MKETDWIDGKIKPVRVGVYKRMYHSGPLYCLFDGKKWVFGAKTANKAVENKFMHSCWQDLPWKGLAHDPD